MDYLKQHRPITRFILLCFAVACLGLGACGGSSKSSSDKANEAVERGLAAQLGGDFDAAEAAYRDALRLEPQNKFALFDLGLIYHTRGDAINAENNYRLAMAIDPAFTPPVYNLAVLRRDAGNLQDAVQLYRRVIEVEPNSALAHYNLGLVLRTLGQTAEGDSEVLKARQLDPTLGNTNQPTQNQTPSPPR